MASEHTRRVLLRTRGVLMADSLSYRMAVIQCATACMARFANLRHDFSRECFYFVCMSGLRRHGLRRCSSLALSLAGMRLADRGSILGAIKTSYSPGVRHWLSYRLRSLHTWASFLRKIAFLHLFIYNDVINCRWPSTTPREHQV